MAIFLLQGFPEKVAGEGDFISPPETPHPAVCHGSEIHPRRQPLLSPESLNKGWHLFTLGGHSQCPCTGFYVMKIINC